MDVINLHWQARDIFIKIFFNSIARNIRMQENFENISNYLHILWVALRTKANQIKESEDVVIFYSGQPKEFGLIKNFLEEKEKEIKGL